MSTRTTDAEQAVEQENADSQRSHRGVLIGRVLGCGTGGMATLEVQFDGRVEIVTARSVVQLGPDDVGSEVAILTVADEKELPILIGVIRNMGREDSATAALDREAQEELVLRCGKSSITLKKDGRILIRGANLLTRFSSLIRIKGGAVQIN